MAYNATITVPPRQWTRVTNAAVVALRVQSQDQDDVLTMATADLTEPSAVDVGAHGEFALSAMLSWGTDRPLSDFFAGITAGHLWVWSSGGARISVSHA